MSQNSLPHVEVADVERLIAQNRNIVIHEGHALDLTTWINSHPGGRLAILHMVGRDATDEMNIYHAARTLLCMKQFRVGRIQEPWTNLDPPIRSPDFYTKEASRKQDAKKGDKENLDRKRRSRASVDLSSVRLLHHGAMASRACAAAIVIHKKLNQTPCTRRVIPLVGVDLEAHPQLRTPIVSVPTVPAKVDGPDEAVAARERYATELEKKEIEDGLRDNPSVDFDTQRAIALEYRVLHQQIKDQGLYACRFSEYGKESIRYGMLFAAFLYLLHIGWYLTSAIALGLFWQQIMFTAHDAAHCGITANFAVDTLIGAFIADFCCGLSIGWWKSSHNVHHLITNDPVHDPDIQNTPLFSNSPTFMKSVLSSFYNFRFVWDGAADFLIPYQKYTYYPVMAVARFNLYMLSWLHLVSPRAAQLGAAWWTRPVEIAFMACYWYIFGYCLVWSTLPDWFTRVAFVLVSHMVTMILHVQITLSHWGMPTSDLGPTESFAQRQLRTTMDVDCPAWLDWFHGGLQFQAVHHLFPRVPRHNLRQVQGLVRNFCDKTQLKYQCYGFVDGNKIVLSRLEEVATMVTTLVECQKHMSETGESGLH
ncbi:Delta 8-(E)-sphingolipid desaturase 2 [Paraphaeosphaeria minitans]|uniref:Delta 8-(E)-sphingolipid desaturase n=1 Tax=Paraphaeosphaeria minitans TaxID=565426 RepID=A0A9P6KJQ7_9PLEO|nr:Delta 8-(E)-sphingolipid desaturase 2 [Paraphaeosphaeria minitans]